MSKQEPNYVCGTMQNSRLGWGSLPCKIWVTISSGHEVHAKNRSVILTTSLLDSFLRALVVLEWRLERWSPCMINAEDFCLVL